MEIQKVMIIVLLLASLMSCSSINGKPIPVPSEENFWNLDENQYLPFVDSLKCESITFLQVSDIQNKFAKLDPAFRGFNLPNTFVLDDDSFSIGIHYMIRKNNNICTKLLRTDLSTNLINLSSESFYGLQNPKYFKGSVYFHTYDFPGNKDSTEDYTNDDFWNILYNDDTLVYNTKLLNGDLQKLRNKLLSSKSIQNAADITPNNCFFGKDIYYAYNPKTHVLFKYNLISDEVVTYNFLTGNPIYERDVLGKRGIFDFQGVCQDYAVFTQYDNWITVMVDLKTNSPYIFKNTRISDKCGIRGVMGQEYGDSGVEVYVSENHIYYLFSLDQKGHELDTYIVKLF
ncbi:MAG: hypothetical protein CVU48_10080 [Candidatus Cloacimonetes bacterium HGW-Cloacimonetes-1]|jgi:hypothetical protein|nr:MAG: hypothetical protein CVU48_10080 [Candidatus Cloacimonetes bacterium HGW-Cloacimonetes-1]